MGANTAEKLYGKPVVDPALYDVSDPEADSMLEATDPTVEHGPAQLLEKVVNEQTGKTVQQAVEEVKPQGEEDDAQVELLDTQQILGQPRSGVLGQHARIYRGEVHLHPLGRLH